MKQIKLTVLSLLALVFSSPVGFRTANAKAPPKPKASKKAAAPAAAPAQPDAPPAEEPKAKAEEEKPPAAANPAAESIADKVQRLENEIAQMRVPAPGAGKAAAPPNATDLLIKGAGVDKEDVDWRIKAGLTAAQAVEVALNNQKINQEKK